MPEQIYGESAKKKQNKKKKTDVLGKEFKISSKKIQFKEEEGEYHSIGPIATTDIDSVGDKILPETLYAWAEELNSTENLDANPLSIHHDRADTTLAGLGSSAKVERREDGEYELIVDTHHNKAHENFKDTTYQINNDFLTHYSIEYNTNQGATTHREKIGEKSIRIIEPGTKLLGYGLASPRTVVNKNAAIVEAGYKELINIEDKSELKESSEELKMPEEKPKVKEDEKNAPEEKKEEKAPEKKEEQPKEPEKKEAAKEISAELKEQIKQEVITEMKAAKPTDAPINNVGDKVEDKEVENKEETEFKELNVEYAEKVIGKERANTSIEEKYRIAGKLHTQLKERNLLQEQSESYSAAFEIKENKIEVKTDVRVESDPAGTTASSYPAILANYEQSPARLNDIYSSVIVDHLNEETVTWNKLRKENGSGMSAIRVRARTARNTVDVSSGYGATPAFTTKVTFNKFNLAYVTNFVPVQVEDEAIEMAKAPGGIGDVFAKEISFSTLDLMKVMNKDQLYGTGDGTSEAISLGLDGGLIITSGNLYGKDVSSFTTLAAAGVDAMGGAKITLKKMRDMYRACIVNGARIQNLAFFTSYLQYHFIYALIQDIQRTVPTSARVGFTGVLELDSIPVFPDPDLDEASMTDDLFLLDMSMTKISIKKAPTFVEFGKVSLHRRGIIWIMWNLFSDAPNRNYHINGLATS